MIISPVEDVLGPNGLCSPILNALVSDANNYKVLLLQPQGVIDATNGGIQSRNRELSLAQFGKFLAEAEASQPDIVVTPEYSMPWDVLKDAIRDPNTGPAEGKLWALGCESIKYSELQAMKDELVDVATVIFEPLLSDNEKFVDPLAYVFRTYPSQNGDEAKLVVLVQLKTRAMADPHDFERNSLQLGTCIYRFSNNGSVISLITCICSDVLDFSDTEARLEYDRALIIHLLLNDNRKHPSMVGFHERLLRMSGDSTEILALNWARGTRVYVDGNDTDFKKFAGSAWYLKTKELDLSDSTLAENHKRGLYYTWFDAHKTHAMFFNFESSLFKLTASKVERVGVQGPIGNRRGPQLDHIKKWAGEQEDWMELDSLKDGFEKACSECGDAKEQVQIIHHTCPLACERLLAICAGEACKGYKWYEPTNLDSFTIDQTELILRMTFCQPSHEHEKTFRLRRLRNCARLWDALQDKENLPASLKDIAEGYTLEWASTARHQNLRPNNISQGLATVMHLGDSDEQTAQAAYNRTRQQVYESLDEISGHRAKMRIAAWYIDVKGGRRLVHPLPQIDDQLGESPTDIGRGA